MAWPKVLHRPRNRGNSTTREALWRMIQATGAYAVTARDGRTAVELLKSVRPHVALVDLLMGGVDGLEFTRRVWADPQHADLPLVAMTVLGTDTDFRHTLESGFDAHLVKLVDFDMVTDVVQRFARLRRPSARRRPRPTRGPSRQRPER